jgi:hypothetical protein
MKFLAIVLLLSSSALAQRVSLSSKEVMGTYVQRIPGFDNINKVRVTPLGKHRLWVDFNFVRMIDQGNGHLGSISGYAKIRGDSATFSQSIDRWDDRTSMCTIGMKFLKHGVLILSDEYGVWDSCAFGYGVSGSGRYKKISSKRPNAK